MLIHRSLLATSAATPLLQADEIAVMAKNASGCRLGSDD